MGFSCHLQESLTYTVRGFQRHRCACKEMRRAAEQIVAISLLLLVSLTDTAQSTWVYFGDTMCSTLLTREAWLFFFFFTHHSWQALQSVNKPDKWLLHLFDICEILSLKAEIVKLELCAGCSYFVVRLVWAINLKQDWIVPIRSEQLSGPILIS